MPDLCHRNPYVYTEILKLAKWMIEDIGFDGFRYDFAKGYGTWVTKAIQEKRYIRHGQPFKPYGVAENWSSDRDIENWLNEVNGENDNPVDAFDFPLRYLLKNLCDQFGFSLRALVGSQTLFYDKPFEAVTFVDNHDFRGGDRPPPVVNDKLLAYSFILTHEGYPCVFWRDYYNWGLAKAGTPNGITALIDVHENLAAGSTNVLWVDNDLYIMQRTGLGNKPGLIFVLNNRGDRWNGAWVSTQWRNIDFEPVAWWSSGRLDTPYQQHSYPDGRAQFWAPPRGYVVYKPKV